jgi:hypothetical protein
MFVGEQHMILEICGETVRVSSFREAVGYVALFLVEGSARLIKEREVLTIGWARWSEEPVVLATRPVGMFGARYDM